MAGSKGVKTRPTLEELREELKRIDGRLDAVHDRANSMERAARMLKDAMLLLMNMPIVEKSVGEPTLDRCRRAVEFATQVGVT